jgi:tetratricopeptide (TPR) repeat protein
MGRTLVSPVFVGRDAELAALTAALDAAVAGDAAVVLLSGEAGVGKTRLVEEAAERAREAGARVLAGGCIEMGGEGLPFGPLAHLFRSLMRDTSPEQLDAFIGPARSELARVLPDLDPDSAPGTAPLGEGGTARLLELVVGVVERLAADRPLMFVIEDLHWADRSTLDLVALLVRALHADRVLVVVTFRTDELHRSHPLRPLVTGWERVRAVQRIELERLGRAEVARQLEAILGEPPAARLVDQVHERSEGNAFLVEEILGAIQSGADPDGLPLSLRDVLLARVERLGPSTQRLLRIAAAGGPAVSDRLLAAVAGLEEAELDAALRDAVEHHVLVVDETERGYVFRHALTRDAVYGDTLPRERVRIHTAYGEALSADPTLAGRNVAVAAALALHWTAAHDLPRALVACVEAAQLAAGYAPAEALRHLERALEIWPQVPDAAERAGIDVVEALGRAGQSAYAAGSLDRSLAMFDEALAELAPDADPERRALLMEARAAAVLDTGREAEARLELERAAALLPAEPPTEARAVVLTALAAQLGVAGDFEAALEAAEQAVAAATGVGARRREATARMMLGMALAYLEGDRGLPELEAGLRLAEEAEDHATALRGHLNLSDALQTLGRSRESAEVAERGMELAARVGLTRSVYGVLVAINRAEAMFHLGQWDEGHRVLTRAMDSGPASPFASEILDHRARIAALAGRYEDARADLEAAHRLVPEPLGVQYSFARAFAAAEMARALGDAAGAREVLRRALAHEVAPIARYSWQLVWLGLRVEAEASEPAPERVSALEALSRELAAATPPALAYQALAAAESARVADHDASWSEAIAATRTAGDPYLVAYALLRHAEVACAAADRTGASPAVQEAARQAASRKTASVHVSNILGKLGVASRGEAAAVAHRLGLDGATSRAS